MKILSFLLVLLYPALLLAQNTLRGKVIDSQTGDPIFGTTVVIKGTTNGGTTDFNGNYAFETAHQLPLTLVVAYMGYLNTELEVTSWTTPGKFKLKIDAKVMKEFEISESSITEEDMKASKTMEKMDLIAIKETSAGSFYEGLGQLKGVDMTTASLGFTIINTRGFNSTSPVRTLQLIDGADNAAPGLGFSIGNFLGASELDILSVDLIVGASSATYGPNAFNGVVNMITKDPFVHQGFSARAKVAERNMNEFAARYAKAFTNKAGEEKFAMKFNLSYMEAYDWVANNSDTAHLSKVDPLNFGGYDAVNRYGDEKNTITNNNDKSPGLGTFFRTGYMEDEIVDYDTENLKLSGALHYKIGNQLEAIYGYNLGYGTTVYQAFNRISLKDILFTQHRAEVRKHGRFFVRTYFTKEDAGNSYDAVLAANQLQNGVKSYQEWTRDYQTYWNSEVAPKIESTEGWEALKPWFDPVAWEGHPFNEAGADSILTAPWMQDSLSTWHQSARDYADGSGNPLRGNLARLLPGTAAYDSALTAIINNPSVKEGGAQLYDKSSLWHIQAEYQLPAEAVIVKIGTHFRKYLPISNGRLFSDTNGVTINSFDIGSYLSAEKTLLNDNLDLAFTTRIDKNNNIDKLLMSPGLSAVYSVKESNTIRISLTSATRNPTLGDQFMYYDIGSAIILGNTSGYDSLVTTESLVHFLETNLVNFDTLAYFDAPPVVPEQVKTIEIGNRAELLDGDLFLDYSFYYSWYRNFIGYKIGATIPDKETPYIFDVYRVTTNAIDVVTTKGFSIGMVYYFNNYLSLKGNYAWNALTQKENVDPIVPSFNTPKHKYNIGIGGHDISSNLLGLQLKSWGFSFNYRWVQGFLYEASPQFTGQIPSYGLLDAQFNVKLPKAKSTLKIGASNLLDNQVFTAYGGPYVGRMGYVSMTFDFHDK